MIEANLNQFKINLHGYKEQDYPGRCPECETEMTWENLTGWGEYPRGGHRAKMKPNVKWDLGFECPECFTKSCHHATMDNIKQPFDNMEFNIACGFKSLDEYPSVVAYDDARAFVRNIF